MTSSIVRTRTYSDGNSVRRSSSESIEIRIDSRSYSIDSRSYSIESRTYSIDSNSGSDVGSFEEIIHSVNKERKHSNPLLIHKDKDNRKKTNKHTNTNNDNGSKRRTRDMKYHSRNQDEPKTVDQVKKELFIYKPNCSKK